MPDPCHNPKCEAVPVCRETVRRELPVGRAIIRYSEPLAGLGFSTAKSNYIQMTGEMQRNADVLRAGCPPHPARGRPRHSGVGGKVLS